MFKIRFDSKIKKITNYNTIGVKEVSEINFLMAERVLSDGCGC